MTGMFDDIKVLEVANWVAAPSACAILADLGANVLKIEHPDTGDPVRSITLDHTGVIQYLGGVNVIFELLNRGKKSLAVDLNSLQGQEIVRKLATQVDGSLQAQIRRCIEGQRSNHIRRVDRLRPGRPRQRSIRIRLCCILGSLRYNGSLGEAGSPPIQQRLGMGDQATSLAITAAIALGLYEREQSGVGQRIDCSLLNTGLWAIGGDLMAALQFGRAPDHISRSEVGNPLFNYYQCADVKWVQLVMIESERFWDGFCRAVGLQQIVADPRFASHTPRSQNNRELIRILDGLFLMKPRAEWAKMLDNTTVRHGLSN